MNLKDYYVFKSLNEQEIKKLESISFVKKFSRGDILFYQGEQSKYLHLLVDGIVKIYKHDFKDNEIVIHNINALSFIAEIANYEEIPFPANCSFETKGEVVFIDYEKFRDEFLYKKDISMLFIKSLTQKIKYLESFINNSVSIDVNAKVAKFIYDNEKTINGMKQIKIAEILNIREETLSRKIANLIKKKIIEKEKRNIKIIDYKNLLEEFM
ncbi:Crp/Fnr family transcriptional regulator [Halarcobacter ebronensis]|uniref:Crp/Fnr family transcriptional regulator n=1 Tax=Halarcobacter ebronensis TaxID=1462615 RepID=A0A4Q1AZZ2_9BACT|nr:Crp/Fnr family transcriptional regulator [Halarcobacter ebronensis]QKF83476.1 putative nitrosative stress-response regulator NssR, Crp/Fnr family [Halarcobacter ebronensis]RXK08273.1 Crp/Fnr family transcriptional regulator [Halarcobacter ebronensis]